MRGGNAAPLFLMRLDIFLKQSGLVKRRPIAKLLCDGGKIARNGKLAKAGDEVRAGDVLALELGPRRIEAEILSVPTSAVPKAERENYFHITRDEKVEEDWI
jgi:ribosomal 50S subunit-recycling heat shock protein